VRICSGDGIFAASAAWLAEADVDVSVVSLPGHLSARLQPATRYVSLLPVAAVAATGSAG